MGLGSVVSTLCMAGGSGKVARDTPLTNGPSTPARQLTGGSSRRVLCFVLFSSEDLPICRNVRSDFWRDARNHIFGFLAGGR